MLDLEDKDGNQVQGLEDGGGEHVLDLEDVDGKQVHGLEDGGKQVLDLENGDGCCWQILTLCYSLVS